MNSRSGDQRRVCLSGGVCGSLRSPRWAADGRAIALTSPGGVELIYPDGSCLDCQAFPGNRPAFTEDPALLTAVLNGALVRYGSDGLPKATVLGTGVSDAVWSARGQLAAVRFGRVWVGAPGRLRSLGRGTSPSWSPDGSRLVVDRHGWVTVIAADGRVVRRLARGSSPAWSPDGRSIAFFSGGYLRVVPAPGGRVRRVGHVRGVAVDWQPLPSKPVVGCVPSPGSTTIASSATAAVTADSIKNPNPLGYGFPIPAYMGCLRSSGREHLLVRFGLETQDGSTVASEAATAGHYAALVISAHDYHYDVSSYLVKVFDLNTGAIVPTLGGEQVMDNSFDTYLGSSNMNGLVLGPDGFSAAHTTRTLVGPCSPSPCPNRQEHQTEQIIAADSSGVHVLDTLASDYPVRDPGASLLTALQLSGDTLSWSHAGTPESAELH